MLGLLPCLIVFCSVLFACHFLEACSFLKRKWGSGGGIRAADGEAGGKTVKKKCYCMREDSIFNKNLKYEDLSKEIIGKNLNSD